jgi:hypothetical protein
MARTSSNLGGRVPPHPTIKSGATFSALAPGSKGAQLAKNKGVVPAPRIEGATSPGGPSTHSTSSAPRSVQGTTKASKAGSVPPQSSKS